MEVYNNELNDQNLQSVDQQEEGVVSLRDLWDFLRTQWKWFVVSVLVCVGIARLYLATKNNVYQRHAVVLIKEEDGYGSSLRRADALMQINGMMSGSGVSNEAYVMGSNMLMQEVVDVLHLDVLYFYRSRLRTVSLYNEKPFSVQFLGSSNTIGGFKARILSANECEITELYYQDTIDNKKVETKETRRVRFGERVSTKGGDFVVVPEVEHLKDFNQELISVVHMNPEHATSYWSAAVNTDVVSKQTSLLRITCTDTNRKRADDIINTLMEVYKQNIIKDKNQVSENTARFIEERIALVGAELGEVEGNLASFKERNRLIDFNQNANAFISRSTDARKHTVELESQQVVVRYLMDYLKSSANGNNLVPSLGGLGDNGIQNQIAKYNDMMLERNRLAQNSGEGSITVNDMDTYLKAMRQTLLASMEGYAKSVDLQVKQARKEEGELSSSLASMPQQERKAIDISRQQTIKETLYTYLLNKREETALQLAVSEANIRIVERPYGGVVPISPRSNIVLLIGLLTGLLLPFAVFYLYTLFNMGVRGRRDIEKFTKIPILGELPRRRGEDNDSGIVVNEKSGDMLSEAFRIMRYNLTFLNKDAKVIMFTSTMPSEGKSFISRNFAYSLAIKGKKAVLVDCDIRRRTQSGVLGANRALGLTSFLSGQVNDYKELLTTAQAGSNVMLLPAGPLPPNPTELLMDERMSRLVEELKRDFDYVLLDSVPAHMMADAALLSRICDLTVYVIRVGGIDRRYLPELQRIYAENRYNNLCVLLNGVVESGSGYGYAYSYNYGYGYSTPESRKKLSYRIRRKIKKFLRAIKRQ